MFTTFKTQAEIDRLLEEQAKNHLHNWEKPPQPGYAEERLKKILALAKTVPHKTILDVGCGYGFYAKELSKLGHVTGIDVSKSIIDQARKNTPEATFYNYSLLKFPKKSSFDLIIAAEVLYFIKDKDKALKILQSLGNYLITSNFLFGFGALNLNGFAIEYKLRRKFKSLKRLFPIEVRTASVITLWEL